LNDLLERYGTLLSEVDLWFASCRERYGDLIVCGRGCSACCRGLFDITLLDALNLRRGFDLLPDAIQAEVRKRALARLNEIETRWPRFTDPWLLNTIPEEEWDEIMPEDDETPCVLLSERGSCLVYDHRPMTCRLNGIPLMDRSGEELFDDWCTMNFIGRNPRELPDLRHPFRDLFAQELLLFRELTTRLLGEPVNEIDTLIPAALCMNRERITPPYRRGNQGYTAP
jgi:Fe-S-cluster containining protein